MKHSYYDELARITGALSSPRRLELADALAQRPHGVEELAVAVGQSTANTSRHLQILRAAHLVSATRQGRHITYTLAPGVGEMFAALRRLGSIRLAELPQVSADIPRGDLLAGLSAGTIQLIDVRPSEEFAAGHLPGACSIPLDALEGHLPTLRADQEVVAYCRGPWCVFADRAVARLREAGFTARRFSDGVSEWTLDGGQLVMP